MKKTTIRYFEKNRHDGTSYRYLFFVDSEWFIIPEDGAQTLSKFTIEQITLFYIIQAKICPQEDQRKEAGVDPFVVSYSLILWLILLRFGDN